MVIYVRIQFIFIFDFAGYSLLLLRLAIFMVFKRHKTLTSHLKLKILKIFGIDGICHYHFGLEIVFICGHYFYVKEKITKKSICNVEYSLF